jgi:hypothetical protein
MKTPRNSDDRAVAVATYLGLDPSIVIAGTLRYTHDSGSPARIRYEVHRELTEDEAATVEAMLR